MAKNKNTFEKRRKEMERKRKANEKREKRRDRKDRAAQPEIPPAPVELSIEVPSEAATVASPDGQQSTPQ